MMMGRRSIAASIALAGFALAACEVEEEPAMDEMAPPAEQPVAEEEPPTAPGQVRLDVAESPELGSYLTDDEGRSVYMFTADSPGESTCYDECASAWPPLLASDTAFADAPEVDEQMIGMIERRDGGMQVTYNDHPLYYYAQDMQPGDMRGHDVTGGGGEWYLLSPDGEPLDDEDDDAADDDAEGMDDTGAAD